MIRIFDEALDLVDPFVEKINKFYKRFVPKVIRFVLIPISQSLLFILFFITALVVSFLIILEKTIEAYKNYE